jgi:hypothetical protein
MVFGFGLNHTSESSVRAKYTIYLSSFLAAIHYYVAFPLVDILFITKEPLRIPKVSRSAYLSGKVPLWIYTVVYRDKKYVKVKYLSDIYLDGYN